MTQTDYSMLTYIIDMFGTSLSAGQPYRDGLSNIFTVCSADWRDLSDLIDEGDYSGLIHGTSISKLDKTDSLYEYTKFLDSNYLSDDNALCSLNFTYGDLSNFLTDNSETAMGLGSMAHESKYHYSKKDHEHNGMYSKVDARMSTDKDLVLDAAKIKITTDSGGVGKTVVHTVRLPNKEYNLPPEPYLGTLKLTMIPSIETVGLVHDNDLYNVDINSDNFDGWVYPNGFKYKISRSELDSRFSILEKMELINGSGDDLSICLPCLSNYFRLNPGNGTTEASRRVEFENAVPNHSHTINSMDISGRIKTMPGQNLVANTASCNNDGTVVHNGNGIVLKKPQQIPFKISCRDIEFQNLKLKNSSSSLDTESEPDHYLIPVMMYIGGRKKSWYQN